MKSYWKIDNECVYVKIEFEEKGENLWCKYYYGNKTEGISIEINKDEFNDICRKGNMLTYRSLDQTVIPQGSSQLHNSSEQE